MKTFGGCGNNGSSIIVAVIIIIIVILIICMICFAVNNNKNNNSCDQHGHHGLIFRKIRQHTTNGGVVTVTVPASVPVPVTATVQSTVIVPTVPSPVSPTVPAPVTTCPASKPYKKGVLAGGNPICSVCPTGYVNSSAAIAAGTIKCVTASPLMY